MGRFAPEQIKRCCRLSDKRFCALYYRSVEWNLYGRATIDALLKRSNVLPAGSLRAYNSSPAGSNCPQFPPESPFRIDCPDRHENRLPIRGRYGSANPENSSYPIDRDQRSRAVLRPETVSERARNIVHSGKPNSRRSIPGRYCMCDRQNSSCQFETKQ